MATYIDHLKRWHGFFIGNVFQQLESQVERLERTVDRQKETISFLRKRLQTLSSKKKPAKIAIAGQETPLSVVSTDNLQKIDRRKIWYLKKIVWNLFTLTVSFTEMILENCLFTKQLKKNLMRLSHKYVVCFLIRDRIAGLLRSRVECTVSK